jgi:hypothetical protein
MAKRIDELMADAVDKVMVHCPFDEPDKRDAMRSAYSLMFLRGALEFRHAVQHVADASSGPDVYIAKLDALDDELMATVYSHPAVVARMGRPQ